LDGPWLRQTWPGSRLGVLLVEANRQTPITAGIPDLHCPGVDDPDALLVAVCQCDGEPPGKAIDLLNDHRPRAGPGIQGRPSGPIPVNNHHRSPLPNRLIFG
jgi:hypothetical protein